MTYYSTDSLPAFKVRIFQAQQLSLDTDVELSPSSSHHLITVMRHKVGDHVAVFNNQNGEWLAEIIKVSKKAATCHIVLHLRQPRSSNGPKLLFSPIKPHRQAFLIEKATELGVSTLMPIISQYTQTRNFNADKVLSQAIEAAEQCERLTIPVIEPIVILKQKLASWNPDQPLLYGAARDQAPSMSEVQAEIKHQPLAFLIGPEGGFSNQELDQFASYPFMHAFNMGDNILRAETAALACLAQAQMIIS